MDLCIFIVYAVTPVGTRNPPETRGSACGRVFPNPVGLPAGGFLENPHPHPRVPSLTSDSMIGLMETRLGAANMLLRGKCLHMRCCAHILNLIIKDVLDMIASVVSNIRECIAYWVATPKKYENFEKQLSMKRLNWSRSCN